ncbi:T9SS type A sorting domain-containing protein [Ferruginibacter sp. HRS2-29]|uniref:T9SS type A sorting domain-containing protein n=1 Tax=Ferruginibacter sp. HRS2-29 TaxID=2487334 RepID=UPI0020CC916A|nr:T9SS type A sorting domain-containing protein [Ferruginibacter sp. HRS2-29]MCP9751606.1 T9SS C-terminal target domain-containing protein [Ferruginibacter sp. HRS2-29]
MKSFYLRLSLIVITFVTCIPAWAQEPALLISNVFINPPSTDDNKEFVELTATRAINFASTPYTVIFADGSVATAANGWATGALGTYAIQISTGTIARGEKIYVGGNALVINGSGCRLVQKNTSAAGDGGIGTGQAAGILGNGGSNADGLAVFNIEAASINNTSVPIDAIFYGDAVGNATGKFIVPTNDRYTTAQGKFGQGTNIFIAPDPGANYLPATGAYDVLTGLFTTPRTWTASATVPNCTAASGISFAAANTLTISVNTALTTTLLAPPVVSGVLNDLTDPAKNTGIVFDIKDNNIGIPSGDYTLTAASTNTAVVALSDIIITPAAGTANVKIGASGVGYSDITLTLTKGAATKTYTVQFAVSASGANSSVNTHYHTSNADASTAVALDDDYMVVSDDEQNKLFVFNRNASGMPLKTFDYSGLLNLTDIDGGAPREIDLEASVKSISNPNRVYWLGSMSNKSSDAPFNPRPNRNRIFATDITGTGAAASFSYAGDYEDLRSRIITWGESNGLGLSASAASGKDPKVIDGFNAEGMCFAPDNSTLYIGFRAPLLPVSNRTRALLVPVLNFESWFGNGSPSAAPAFGSPVLLDLGGMGIRSIDRLSNNTYVIIAGNFDDAAYNGAVYTWNGNPLDAPVAKPGFIITGMSPESFLQVNTGGIISNNKLQMISDNGTVVYYNDGIAAKDLANNNFKKFRSDVVTSVGAPLPITYNLFDLRVQQWSNVLLTWNVSLSAGIHRFEVQRANAGGSYSTIAGISQGSSATHTYLDENLASGNYEYRIRSIDANGQSYYSALKTASIGYRYASVKLRNNPVKNELLSISFADNSEKELYIFNAAGALVYQGRSKTTQQDIPMKGMASGNYVLKVISGGKVEAVQFLK